MQQSHWNTLEIWLVYCINYKYPRTQLPICKKYPESYANTSTINELSMTSSNIQFD